jgi:tetratricopeptide (TPR) repeat protein
MAGTLSIHDTTAPALTLVKGNGTSLPLVMLRSTLNSLRDRPRFYLLTALLALGVAPAMADEGWQLLAGYLFRDAHEAFVANPSTDDRRHALGTAASLINHPPVTPGKITRAETLLRELLATEANDETAHYARYLLARIAHLHRTGPVAEVEAAYRAVIAADAAYPLAQIAAGKLALVLLYQRPELTITERLDAAAELAPIAGRETLPEAACAYYRALAGAALFYDVLDERVYAWLQRADAIGTADVLVASGLRIQLAEIARELGHRDEALAHYRRFLGEILPTDNRYRTATERMQELETAP